MRVTDPAAAAAGTLTLTASGDEQLLSSVRRALAAEYDVEHELGRGGMAVVFKARDKELDRPVALKVLPPELAPVATVADRFKREARLAASLDHPNIIPVYRVAQAGGVLYMAMKFIDGRSLDAVVADTGPLPLAVILTVLRAAARALAFAHDHRIVHRDIKGANILIDRDGRVVVSDFGIARAVESSTLTATGVMIGTPHFMSPEQCSGKAVGPQSDQYSLGVVAYQLLTGSVPFDGDSLPEILQHHWFTPPPDISMSRPDTPAALTAAVLRLLAKDPAERFQSTNDLVATLESIPFPAAERAAGEARLRALAAPKAAAPVAGAGHTVPALTAPPADVAPAAPAPAAPGPAAVPRTGARQAAPTQPIAATSHTVPATQVAPRGALEVQPAPARSAATVVEGARGDARGPAAQAPTARRKPPAPARRGRSTRPWRLVASVLVVLLCLTGVVKAVSVRRSAVAAGKSPALPPRLDATAMRDAGDRAYRAGAYELARRFFVRAVAADPTDQRAQDQLACALSKLGRTDGPQPSKGSCG